MYTNSIVAFIDLLGSKERMLDPLTTFDEAFRIAGKFNRALLDMNGHFNSSLQIAESIEYKTDLQEVRFSQDKGTVFFSDCVIWSFPIEEIKIRYELFLHHLLNLFYLFQFVLLQDGIVARGCITSGPFYQDKSKIFGPSLVKAVIGERKAIYPRILIDKNIIDEATGKLSYLIDPIVTLNRDGKFYHIDLFKQMAHSIFIIGKHPMKDKDFVSDMNEMFSNDIKRLVPVMNNGLKARRLSVRLKYFWLYEQAKSHSILDPFFAQHSLVKLPWYITLYYKFQSYLSFRVVRPLIS